MNKPQLSDKKKKKKESVWLYTHMSVSKKPPSPFDVSKFRDIKL